MSKVEIDADKLDALIEGLRAVSELIDASEGVADFQNNCDAMDWADFRTGGQFEEWLIPFDEALKIADEIQWGGK